VGFWEGLHDGEAGRWPDGPGGQALASLHAGGIVEPDWAVVHPGGFEWWGSSQAQRVGVTCEQTLDGLRVSRLLLEADLCGALPDTAEARQQVDLMNQHASLSAVARNGRESSRRPSWCTRRTCGGRGGCRRCRAAGGSERHTRAREVAHVGASAPGCGAAYGPRRLGLLRPGAGASA
jgi:hypothetical protein